MHPRNVTDALFSVVIGVLAGAVFLAVLALGYFMLESGFLK